MLNNKPKDFTKNDGVQEYREELSAQTLELMLFREMILNADFMGRVSEIVNVRWFLTPHIRTMADLSLKWYRSQGSLITKDIMEAMLQKLNENQVIEANKIDITRSMHDFNKAKELDLGGMSEEVKVQKLQRFVKKEELRQALLDSATMLESKDSDSIISKTLQRFESVQKIVFERQDFGSELSSDKVDETMEKHMDFLTNPAARISTGWNCLDDATHGGFYKDGKSIYVFMAQAGLGKSNILANIGYNLLKQNLNVVLVSMEMSENVYLRRFDSLISKVDIDELGFSSLAPVVDAAQKRFFNVEHPSAHLVVKEFSPNSQTSKTIGQFLEKLIEEKGWKPDVLLLDYLNLIKPNTGATKGDGSMYLDGKVVSEDVRQLSYEFGIPIITAVQCNSSGFNTADIGMQNIAESRGIAHTADFIAGLYQTEDEQDQGVFHMKILKSRLGSYKNLKFQFDKRTMEFTDINDVGDTASTIVEETKKSSVEEEIDQGLFGSDLGMP